MKGKDGASEAKQKKSECTVILLIPSSYGIWMSQFVFTNKEDVTALLIYGHRYSGRKGLLGFLL